MIAQLRQITQNEQLRTALDWMVFTIGALSLAAAITATVVIHTADSQSTSPATTEVANG